MIKYFSDKFWDRNRKWHGQIFKIGVHAFFHRGVKEYEDAGKIEPAMFAPCGMNCQACYKHCYHKKPCAGCLNSDLGKPEHCRKCKIKDCAKERKLTYCFECLSYPCKQIKALEKSYNTRYHASLIENSSTVREQGLLKFLEKQRGKYSCPECGGIISIHDGECSECQSKIWQKGKEI